MKTNIFKILIGIALLTTVLHTVQAQTNTGINLTSQPIWGPTGFNRVDYYYLPDLESYYSISSHEFIYLSGGRWVFSVKLPPRYRNYDLYSGYKVVINRPRPYLNIEEDRVKYAKYKAWNGKKQETISNSHDSRYKRLAKPATKAKG